MVGKKEEKKDKGIKFPILFTAPGGGKVIKNGTICLDWIFDFMVFG